MRPPNEAMQPSLVAGAQASNDDGHGRDGREAGAYEMIGRLRAQNMRVQFLQEAVGHLVFQIGAKEGAVMGLRVKDASRPTFIVSYPKLVVARNGERRVQDATADDVLVQGVEWIAGALARMVSFGPSWARRPMK